MKRTPLRTTIPQSADVEKAQAAVLDAFKGALDDGTWEFVLLGMSLLMEGNIETMRSEVITGTQVRNHALYKRYYKVFYQIYASLSPREGLLPIFGVQVSDFKGTKMTKAQVLKELAAKMDAGVNKKTSEYLYFSNEEGYRILRGIREYNELLASTPATTTPVRERLSLSLYLDAHEIFIKVLKDIYCRQHNVLQVRNDVLYRFLDQNYPALRQIINNNLRNDFGHLTYSERDQHSLEEIDHARDKLMILTWTAIIARSAYLSYIVNKGMSKLIDD